MLFNFLLFLLLFGRSKVSYQIGHAIIHFLRSADALRKSV